MSKTKLGLFALIAILASAIFVRLGIWQLSRLHQRRALNALVIARTAWAPVDARTVMNDSAAAHYRRVTVTGSPDYDHELIWAARTHNGAPGANLITPMHLAGSDTAILVDRGWVYSPDGATLDESKLRESDSTFTGYVEEIAPTGGRSYTDRPRTLARLGLDDVRKTLPYPVAPVYVVALNDSSRVAAEHIIRLSIPPLDEGPHMNYAIQWFSFAVVTLVGLFFVFKQSRSENVARAVADARG